MQNPWVSTRPRILGITLFGLALAAAGCAALIHGALEQVRQAFEADARAAHQQLAQQVAQAEALLATLTLLQPTAPAAQPGSETRLSALYPAVQKMLQRDATQSWPAPWQALLDEAEAASRSNGQTALTGIDMAAGRCWIVRRGEPASFALQLDLKRVVAESETLLASSGGVRAWLEHGGERRMITAMAEGSDFGSGWHFGFRQRLAGDKLPIDLVAVKRFGWLMLPWAAIVGWCAAVAWMSVILHAWLKATPSRDSGTSSRAGGRRRSDLVASAANPSPPWAGQRAPAGGTPVPLRSLWTSDIEPPELSVAKGAIAQAARDSRHAADVIGRLRRTGHAPGSATRLQAVRLDEIVRDALELASPECERLGVLATLSTQSDARTVLADVVALEQVAQQLINRALQALAHVPLPERQLDLSVQLQDGHVVFIQRDNGPAPTPDQLERLFAGPPADTGFTVDGVELTDAGRRAGDLHGSGALVQAMGGSLSAMPASPRGTVFRLVLPLAD